MKQVLVILFILVGGEITFASEHRIALLSEAEVQSEIVFLANLLPQNAPDSLKEAAERISLGRAPQNGTARRISRDFIQRAMQNATFSDVKLLIPESVTIQRKSRIITREEVFVAIQNKLAKNPNKELQNIQPNDLTLENTMQVSPNDAHLKVSQISFDNSVERVCFRLESESTPTLVSFYATAHVHHVVTGIESTRRESVPKPESHQLQKLAAEPILVEAGHYAHLHLHSESSDITLAVKPLQSGRLGDKVRVRMPLNAKILQARVVGKESLDAVF